jgi:hypothetical protein
MASRQEPWTKLAHSKKQPGWVAYNPRTMRPQPLGDDTKHMKILSYNVNGVKNVVSTSTHLKESFVVSTSTPLAYNTLYQNAVVLITCFQYF